MESHTQYVYLLQIREFVNSSTPVYKIGRTKQNNLDRFNSYPKGSILLYQRYCKDCLGCEYEIIALFDKKYKKRKEYGNEYFEGDCDEMIDDIHSIVKNLNNTHDGNKKEVKNKYKNIDVKTKVLYEKSGDTIPLTNTVCVQPNADGVVEANPQTPVILTPDAVVSEFPNEPNVGVKPLENTVYATDKTEGGDQDNLRPKLRTHCKYRFSCEKCSYFTNIKSCFHKHIASTNHIEYDKRNFRFECKKCNKKYETQSGLWKHKQFCEIEEVKPYIIEERDLTNIVSSIILQIKERNK